MMEMEQPPTRQYTPTPTNNHSDNPSYANTARTSPRSSHAQPRKTPNEVTTNNDGNRMQQNTNTINISNANFPNTTSTKSGKHNNNHNLRNQQKRKRFANAAQQHYKTNPSGFQPKSRQQPSSTPNTTMAPPRKKQKSANQPTKPPIPPTQLPPIPPPPPPPPPPNLTVQIPADNQYTCLQCNDIFDVNHIVGMMVQ